MTNHVYYEEQESQWSHPHIKCDCPPAYRGKPSAWIRPRYHWPHVSIQIDKEAPWYHYTATAKMFCVCWKSHYRWLRWHQTQIKVSFTVDKWPLKTVDMVNVGTNRGTKHLNTSSGGWQILVLSECVCRLTPQHYLCPDTVICKQNETDKNKQLGECSFNQWELYFSKICTPLIDLCSSSMYSLSDEKTFTSLMVIQKVTV